MVFDLLYVKGYQNEECNAMQLKLIDRKKILSRIIKSEKFSIEFIEGSQTNNIEIIEEEFEKSISRNEEGLILKQLDSVYIPNDRSIQWIKMKADYIEGLIDTLDLIIIGGYFGEGKVRIGVH